MTTMADSHILHRPTFIPLRSSEHENDGKYHLLLAASGSVATIKIPNIVDRLSHINDLSIRIVLTRAASHFLQGQSQEQPDLITLGRMRNVDAIYHDEDEWTRPWVRDAPILHIELRRWANLLVIAPLSANTLAKIASGLCDNLLTSVVRAWQVEEPPPKGGKPDLTTGRVKGSKQKLIVVAPAMNTAMWRHPFTSIHLDKLGPNKLCHWFEVLWPVEKTLACGDTGDGAMCDWKEIVAFVENDKIAHEQQKSLASANK